MSSVYFGSYDFERTLDCIREAWNDFHMNPNKYNGKETDWALQQTERIMHIQYVINASVILKDELKQPSQLKKEFLSDNINPIVIDQSQEPIVFNTEIEASASGEEAKAIEGNTIINDPIYNSLEGKSSVDIFKEELEAWGIDKNSFAYECVILLAEVGKAGMSYKMVTRLIAEHTHTNPGVVSIAFNRLIRTADFSKTKYNPVLKSIKQLTKEFVVLQLLDFCGE